MTNSTADPQPESHGAAESVPNNRVYRNFPKAVLLGIVLFVLLSLTIYGTYWYTKNYLVIPSSQPTVSEVTSGKPQPKNSFGSLNNQVTPAATDETANWKTFNSKYGWSIKYPKDWQLVLENLDREAYVNYKEPNQPSHGGFPYGINIDLMKPIDNPSNLSTKDFAVKDNSQKEVQTTLTDMKFSGIMKTKAVIVGMGKTILYYISIKDKILIISESSFTTNESPANGYKNLYDYEKVFDQILSTFKFL